jgi:hypothetical protein
MGNGDESERLEDIRSPSTGPVEGGLSAKPSPLELQRRLYWRVPDEGLQRSQCEEINYACYNLANQLVDDLPPGRNLSLALTALEEVRMRACAAIILDKKP